MCNRDSEEQAADETRSHHVDMNSMNNMNIMNIMNNMNNMNNMNIMNNMQNNICSLHLFSSFPQCFSFLNHWNKRRKRRGRRENVEGRKDGEGWRLPMGFSRGRHTNALITSFFVKLIRRILSSMKMKLSYHFLNTQECFALSLCNVQVSSK
jgi:hypothetical protein